MNARTHTRLHASHACGRGAAHAGVHVQTCLRASPRLLSPAHARTGPLWTWPMPARAHRFVLEPNQHDESFQRVGRFFIEAKQQSGIA